ncbi:MAG: hypothetical protein KKG59_03385 [Nanoarchaeota archaeon]|nr:hypothetical protein [Nanoarchaeota archaeon]
MEKSKMLIIRITPKQNELLLEKARSAGFLKKSEYIRSVLFRSIPLEEKINQIHNKVCKNG